MCMDLAHMGDANIRVFSSDVMYETSLNVLEHTIYVGMFSFCESGPR